MMQLQDNLKKKIGKVIGIWLSLILAANCQTISKPVTTQNTPTSGNTINAQNHQKNNLVESCIVHREKARKFRLAGKIQEAADEFQKAIETGCNEVDIHRELAEMYRGLGQFDRSVEEYRLLLSLDSNDLRGHWALASVFVLDTKNYEEGLSEALVVRKMLDEKDYVGRRGVDKLIGQAQDGLGNFSIAIKYYKDYLKGCSQTPDSSDCKATRKRVLELEEDIR